MAYLVKQTPKRKRGRKPKKPLLEQVEAAFSHIHDLDWLQQSELSNLSEVQQRVRLHHTMPEAWALRESLIEAALQVIQDIEKLPNMTSVKIFLESYLQGKKVTEIAKELGVSREWCSRSYRRDAFRFAVTQFVRSVSRSS